MLGAQGMNEAVFEQRLREDLARQTLLDGVARSAIVPTAMTDRLAALVQETRTVRERRFRPEDFVAQVSVGDDATRSFYEARRAQFETKERIDVQLLALTLEDVARQVELYLVSVSIFGMSFNLDILSAVISGILALRWLSRN